MHAVRRVEQIKSVILYSTGCPKCNVLKKKLAEKGVQYEENNSVETMLDIGITVVPVLKVDDNLLNFSEAVSWLNQQ